MSITMAKRKLSERLERLANSGICPAANVEEYADELKQLVGKIVDAEQINRQSRLLKALANPTRLKIYNLLQIREMCVCEIMAALGLTQPTASHHLNILENVSVVKERKEGRWIFYSLIPDATQSVLSFPKRTAQ